VKNISYYNSYVESGRRLRIRAVLGILLTLLFMSMLTLAFNIQPAKADPRTLTVNDDGPADPVAIVAIDPLLSTATAGETFSVNITVTGITEERSLYGWEIALSFDPSVLEVAWHIEQRQIPGTDPPIY